MPRRRRVLSFALLLVLLGAGGGYWLANREPDPVLRTIVLTSAQPAFFEFDEGEGRLYFLTNDASGPLSILNTRSGNPVSLHGALASVSAQPIVDHQSGHYFDADSTGGQMLMIGMRTDAVLKRIPIQAYYDYWFDATQDRVVLVFRDPGAPQGLVIDGRTGGVVHDLGTCPATPSVTVVAATQRVFVMCADGGLQLLDSRSYRQLLRTGPIGMNGCTWCLVLPDVRTGRVFVPGAAAAAVLDARSGALVRRLPVGSWGQGSMALLPGAGGVVLVPYVAPGAGPPARAVLVLDGRTGAITHRWPVPENPTQVLLNPLTGHLLVASAGPLDGGAGPLGFGTLSVLDVHSGAILRQVQTGIFPGDIAADSRTRHLFVVNFNTAMDDQLSPLSRRYPDGWWPQFLRWLKGLAGWLPFTAPQPPPPPGTVTVTMMDLTKL